MDGEIARGDLVAELPHRVGGGADEGDPGGGAGVGEFRALGEEPIAGMDGVGARALGDAQDLGDREVGLDRSERLFEMRPAADQVGLVGLEAVEGELVFLGEDADRLQPKLVCGAKDPDGDLRAVRDENLADFRQPGPQRHLPPA